jgi:hypothetical protein
LRQQGLAARRFLTGQQSNAADRFREPELYPPLEPKGLIKLEEGYYLSVAN